MNTKSRITMFIGLVGFVIGVWLVWTSTGQWLGSLPSATRTAVIGFVGIVLVPVITFFTTRSLQQRRARDDAIREKRTDFYDKAMRGLLLNLGLDQTVKKPTPKQQVKFIANITPDFVLYGSRGVVRAWVHFRAVGQDSAPTNVRILWAFENLLRAMRRDLGHLVPSSRDLELLRMFVNDLDTLLPQRQPRLRKLRRRDPKTAGASPSS